MKPFVVCVAIACLAVVSADLLASLKAIHSSEAFLKLPHRQQILVVELTAEAEIGQLKPYIDHIGYEEVLLLLDLLPEQEAHFLNHMILQELVKEGHTTPAVGRRSLVDILNGLMHNDTFQRLSANDQQMVKTLLSSARNNTVTQYVNQLGYTEVLRLLDALSAHAAHQLNHFIVQEKPVFETRVKIKEEAANKTKLY